MARRRQQNIVPISNDPSLSQPEYNAMMKLYGRNPFLAAQGTSKMLFADKSLGRLNNLYDTRTGAINDPFAKDVQGRLQAGLEGYSAPENQALREQMQREGDMAYQGNLAQLAKAQARGGTRGAASTAQFAQLAQGRQQSRDTQEQDLYAKNIDEKRSRLADYATYTSGLRKEQSDAEKYNLEQVAAEKAGYAGTLFGVMGLKQGKTGLKGLLDYYKSIRGKGS
jgi:hypothetical protein